MKTAEWERMLNQLRDSLDQSAIEVARHEQALQSPLLTSDLSDERHTSWQRALERVSERLQDCQVRVEQAERRAADDEAALNEHQEEAAKFLRSLERMRGQLANLPPEV